MKTEIISFLEDVNNTLNLQYLFKRLRNDGEFDFAAKGELSG